MSHRKSAVRTNHVYKHVIQPLKQHEDCRQQTNQPAIAHVSSKSALFRAPETALLSRHFGWRGGGSKTWQSGQTPVILLPIMSEIQGEALTESPAIEILTDDTLGYILNAFVGDLDLGRCLLAWRGFHVLDSGSLNRRKYRCATVYSVCIANDLSGLRFMLDNPTLYMPPPSVPFNWSGCLFGAAVAGNVAMLDTIKEAIHARGNDGPWPVLPIVWWSLAFAAAQRGQHDALAWLCLSCNKTSSQPVISAEQMRDLVPMAGFADDIIRLMDSLTMEVTVIPVRSPNDIRVAEQTLYALFEPTIVARVRTSLMDMGRHAVNSICDRVSHESGLDAHKALGCPVFAIPDAAYVRPSADDLGLWKRALAKARSFVEDRIGHHNKDSVWTYRVERITQGRLAIWTLSIPTTSSSGTGSLEPTWHGPDGVPFGPGTAERESMFWTMIAVDAAEAGNVHVLNMLRDRPIDKDDGGPMSAALEKGHLDVVAWLCARGYDRARVSHLVGRCHGRYTVKEDDHSFIYRALCERRFDIVRLLLDPTVDEGISGDVIRSRITIAVSAAVLDALMSGNLTVITWLHERYRGIVHATVAHARATQRWAVVSLSDRFDPVLRLTGSHHCETFPPPARRCVQRF